MPIRRWHQTFTVISAFTFFFASWIGGDWPSLPDHWGTGIVQLGPPGVHLHVPLQSARDARRRLRTLQRWCQIIEYIVETQWNMSMFGALSDVSRFTVTSQLTAPPAANCAWVTQTSVTRTINPLSHFQTKCDLSVVIFLWKEDTLTAVMYHFSVNS